MIVTPDSPSAVTASTLSAGSRSDRIRSTPSDADGLGDVGVIAGHHHDPFDTRAPEHADHARRVRADRVVQDEHPRHPAVGGDEDAGRALHRAPPPNVARTGGISRPRVTQGRLADGDLPAIDAAADPEPPSP
jgi:hypothetical protein